MAVLVRLPSMRKISTILLCIILITSCIGIFSIPTTVAEPITIYVDDSNVAGPWDGTQDHPYQLIQNGIDNAYNPGDIIYVYPGTYVEQIDVTMSLILNGENKSTTIVNGGFNVTQDTTTIQNFTITYGYEWDPDGVERNGTHRAGIRTNSSGNTFANNTIYDISGGVGGDDEDFGGGTGGSGVGIFLVFSTSSRMQNNTIENIQGGNGGGGGSGGFGGNSSGIYITSSSGITITQNSINDITGGTGGNDDPVGNGGVSSGIFLNSTTSATITQNTINNITGGIGGSKDFGGNGGIGAGIFLLSSEINTITNNIISQILNGTAGVGSIASGIDGMGVGLYVNNSDGNTISVCSVTFGYSGISLVSSSNNLCYDNYFSNNSYHAYDDGTNTWNIAKTPGINIIGGSFRGGNYWSNYTGLDGDNDGLGDSPYDIPGGSNQDLLPLVNQPPNVPSNPTPTDDAPDVVVTSDLSWDGGDPDLDQVTYTVYFGLSNPPPEVIDNQTGTTYDTGTMDHGTIYYWKIVAWDSNRAATPGPLWNFMTQVNYPPVAPNTPYPSNNSTGIPIIDDLSWTSSDLNGDTLTYDMYFGLSTPPPKVASNQTDSSYDPGTMAYNATYYWKVIAWDPYASSNSSPLWHFNTTSPASNPPAITGPVPAHGSTGVSLSLSVLRVTIVDIDSSSFNWTITTSPNIGNSFGINAINGTKNCTITGSLVYSTTYTWTINASDGVYWNTKTFSFTTTSGDSGPPGPGPEPPPSQPNKMPIADAVADGPYQGLVNTEIVFDGSDSYDPDGNITEWLWDFGDGKTGSGETIGHAYSQANTYTITLTVTDERKATDTDTATCIIRSYNRPPSEPQIVNGPTTGTKNTLYNYTVMSVDSDNDTLRYTFRWGDEISYENSSSFIPAGTSYTCGHRWTAAGCYIVTITVSDNQEEVSTNITVYIDAMQTRGAGYLLDYDGDGVYDAFYSQESQQTITTIQHEGDSYLIDTNGDGEWDYKYNATYGITSYQKPRKTPGFELAFVIIALVSVFCIRYYRKMYSKDSRRKK
jgi:parallel beta-helix repeat protein